MTKRITPQVKAIADAHINARMTGKFDDPAVSTREELLQALREGKTFSELLRKIEARYCSITSIMIGSHFQHASNSYKTGVYKGFKSIFP